MLILFWPGSSTDQELAWKPRVDVYRTGQGWVLKLDLAGVDPEELGIEVTGSAVKISGARRDRYLRKGWRCHSMEISYNRFERVVDLPGALDKSTLKVECDQGMLLIHVNASSRPE